MKIFFVSLTLYSIVVSYNNCKEETLVIELNEVKKKLDKSENTKVEIKRVRFENSDDMPSLWKLGCTTRLELS